MSPELASRSTTTCRHLACSRENVSFNYSQLRDIFLLCYCEDHRLASLSWLVRPRKASSLSRMGVIKFFGDGYLSDVSGVDRVIIFTKMFITEIKIKKDVTPIFKYFWDKWNEYIKFYRTLAIYTGYKTYLCRNVYGYMKMKRRIW